MYYFGALPISLCLFGWLATEDENAAIHYLTAFLQARSLPAVIDSSTTDDGKVGFANLLSDEQTSFLDRTETVAAKQRFLLATSSENCDWTRFAISQSQTDEINKGAHRLARIILLFARKQYEAGNWDSGNDLVVRTMFMARHVARQARTGENQCYMIENMARCTVSAYLLSMPQDSRLLIDRRIRELSSFVPMREMFLLEAALADELAGMIDSSKLDEMEALRRLRVLLRDGGSQKIAADFSRQEMAVFLRDLSSCFSDLSELMPRPIPDAMKEFNDNIGPKIKRNPMALLTFGSGSEIMWLRIEDAQSECRAAMFRTAVKFVDDGESAIIHGRDPFGDGPFTIRKENSGFTILSALRDDGLQIDLRIGLAANSIASKIGGQSGAPAN